MNPLVSVLMTAYNREHYIAEAIESVLDSTFTDFELVIVDDGSTDNTVTIAKSYQSKDARIKLYVNEKNLGDYPNRNKAASYATGKFLKYLDSDDKLYSYGLDVFVTAMEKFPEAVLGVSSKNNLPYEPFPLLLSPRQSYYKHFFEYGLLDFGPSGVIIRRDAFLEVGGFSGKRYIGDQECWMKLAALNPIVELPPSLIFWRQHEGQEYQMGSVGLDGGYFLMTLPLLREVFANAKCPLTKEEKEKILRTQHRQYARSMIKHILKTGEIRKVVQRSSELKVPLTDFF